jgi:HEAT repeat protein
MSEDQYPASPTNMNRAPIYYVSNRHFAPSRIFRNLLMGAGIVLVLTLIEAGIFGLINPSHFSALVPFIISAPYWLLLPLVEFLLAFLLVQVADKPLALGLYLQDAQKAQESYRRIYTPLTALSDIYETPVSYYRDTGDPALSGQGQNVSVIDLIRQGDTHHLILGVPGAGKTMALRVYQYIASQQRGALVRGHDKIPVYVPMKNYSLFLKGRDLQNRRLNIDEPAEEVRLLDFLYESDLPGMNHLRPYLGKLMEQGRILFLCDGLNEIDSNYLDSVVAELAELMRRSENRLVMTCREVDYRKQPQLAEMVNDGQVTRAVIYPLQPEEIRSFVERYIEEQGDKWQHTAGQIMQMIDRCRLRYHCTNPMMLFTLMQIIDKIGVERGKQIDTRGRLLREFVAQLIEREQKQPKWSKGGKVAPTEIDVIQFLSEVACAARWANDRSAIQLRVPTASPTSNGVRRGANIEEQADELQFWLDEHPPQAPVALSPHGRPQGSPPHIDTAPAATEPLHEPYDRTQLAQLLQFAQSAALVDISPNGILSFRHELIAEYFVAEYFFAVDRQIRSGLPIRQELLLDVGRWSEPVAIWAGLLDDPMGLADRLATLGRSNPACVLQALAMSLVCIGVVWMPAQAETSRPIVLPSGVEEALGMAVRNKEAREELARIFTRCAEEDGQEVYHSLLPLLTIEGVDELLLLLDQSVVPELLFKHLCDTVDNVTYDDQVRRLIRVLGRFGGVVVARAAELSRPGGGRSIRLRAAAINILGGTREQRAVEPLIARLSDSDQYVYGRATNALMRLGPELTLTRVIQELEHSGTMPATQQIHWAVLAILGRFLTEQNPERQLTARQYQRTLEALLPVLTSNYAPDAQQKAKELLVQEVRAAGHVLDKSITSASSSPRGAPPERVLYLDSKGEKVVELLLRHLASRDDMMVRNVVQTLQEIGPAATSRLLMQLESQPSEIVRMRLVEVLGVVHDPRALPRLLRLVADPALAMQQQVAIALRAYAPESIPGLIDLVLRSPDEPVATRAAQILRDIGEEVVEPVIEALRQLVPGRTLLLVHVLESVNNPQAIPALIPLLENPEIEPLLAVAIIRALSQFRDPRVVPPLIAVLANPQPHLYEEAVNALSHLGEVAIAGLVAALDIEKETPMTQRVRRALLGMVPFPGQQLLAALSRSSKAQVQQIMNVFVEQGADAAQLLVDNLFHPDERVQGYVRSTLAKMDGRVVIPAVLEALNRPGWRSIAPEYLLKYRQAIPPLVSLLSDHDRCDAAAGILLQFGPDVLPSLVPALDEQDMMAREYAQSIIIELVRQAPDVVYRVVSLFSASLSQRAYKSLLDIVTDELADVSIPALLDGLEDAHLLGAASEGLVRLVHRRDTRSDMALQGLLDALRRDERRHGAEITLVEIGAQAVPGVGNLITDPDREVVQAAKRILRDLGVLAFSFIWAAHSDTSNPARREAALDIFRSMPTVVIKDELVELLTSDSPENISMAMALLWERIHDEATEAHANQEMIPALLEHVQMHGNEHSSLRIMALLLLLSDTHGHRDLINHIIQVLYADPEHQKRLVQLFVLLGGEATGALAQILDDPQAPQKLREEVAGVLGMIVAHSDVYEYAINIGNYGYGPSSNRARLLHPNRLRIALRALGGLLVGGHWNISRLQELLHESKEGSAERELYTILLGGRYGPQITRLENDLETERDAHKKDIREFSTKIMVEHERIQDLERELEQARNQHSQRSDELDKAAQEKQILLDRLNQALKERQALQEQYTQQRALNIQLSQELQSLRAPQQKNS